MENKSLQMSVSEKKGATLGFCLFDYLFGMTYTKFLHGVQHILSN